MNSAQRLIMYKSKHSTARDRKMSYQIFNEISSPFHPVITLTFVSLPIVCDIG
jgi:hypothetical protein